MDSALAASFHARLDTAVDQLRSQLLQEWDQAFANPQPDMLWQWERVVFGRVMSLGRVVVVLFLEAVHAQAVCLLGWSRPPKGYRQKGWRWTKIATLFGGCFRLRSPYAVVDRQGRPGRRRGRGKRGAQGSGCFPLLETLGCRAGATPGLLGEVASQVAWGPSLEVASQRLADRGIDLHPSTVRRLSYALADAGLNARQQALQPGRLPPGSEDFEVKGKRVVISVDGGRLRLRVPHPGRRRASGYHGFDTPWQRPRLMVLYLIDEQGRAMRQELPLYDGVLTSAPPLFELLFDYLQALHLEQAQQVIFIADGAAEHWDYLVHLIEGLHLPPQKVVEVLDWAHALEHLTTVADLCVNWTAQQRRRWLQQQRTRLAKGQLEALLNALATLAQGRRANALQTEIDFFHKHAARMRYAHFRKRHIPLGSGAVESAMRRVVNLRLKGPGRFWLAGNGQGGVPVTGRWLFRVFSTMMAAEHES